MADIGITFVQWAGNPWIMHVFFLSVRLAGVLMLTPILYAHSLPPSMRVMLVFSLSVAIASGMLVPQNITAVFPSGAEYLIPAALKELMLGATFSIGILIAFAAISVAGRLLDIQIGFGVAQVFDPMSQTQLPVITTAFNQLGVIFFFLIDGHHTILRAIALSVEKFPLGASWSIENMALPVLKQVGVLFSLGFSLAAPVVFCVLLVELALGVVSRNMPQMNMFVVGVPIKIVVGLITLSIWFLAMGNVFHRIYGSIFQTWDWMFFAAASPAPISIDAPVLKGVH